jgi:hypothetical protein
LHALTDRSRRPVRYADQLPQQVESPLWPEDIFTLACHVPLISAASAARLAAAARVIPAIPAMTVLAMLRIVFPPPVPGKKRILCHEFTLSVGESVRKGERWTRVEWRRLLAQCSHPLFICFVGINGRFIVSIASRAVTSKDHAGGRCCLLYFAREAERRCCQQMAIAAT